MTEKVKLLQGIGPEDVFPIGVKENKSEEESIQVNRQGITRTETLSRDPLRMFMLPFGENRQIIHHAGTPGL